MSDTIKLNPHRHFYLYAKGHYKRGDVIEDLGNICTNYLEHDLHNKNDRIRILLRATNSLKKPYTIEKILEEVLNASHEYNMPFDFNQHELSATNAIINGTLFLLRHATVDEIEGSLGKTDFSILPSWREDDKAVDEA